MATLDHFQLEELWLLAGGSPADRDTAAAIAQAESGGCQYAKAGPKDDRPVKECTFRRTNLEDSYGLWQINRRAHPQYSAASLYTTTGNANAAVAIRTARGNFTDWTTYKDGTYRQYLTSGGAPPPQPGTGDTLLPANVGSRSLSAWNRLSVSLGGPVQDSLHRSAQLRAATLRRLGKS